MGAALYLLFFCSGVAGLIYQVVWVRAFGTVFGNTIQSASIVIAVFMLGLGVGSYVVGRWADRRYAGLRSADRPHTAPKGSARTAVPSGSLLRAFGAFEMAIGVLALGVSALLPHLGTLSAAISSYARGADGWYALSASSYLARAILAVGLLAPITLLMGGTLTLLIRHLVREDLHAGTSRIARLYAVNTAGAAAGCALTDLALVPAVGIGGTQLVAFACNFVAGLGAFVLAQHRGSEVGDRGLARRTEGDPSPQSPIPNPQPPIPDPRSPVPAVALAIALAGFAAMGMEIVWFRHFSMLLGEYRAVFSLLLAIILSGIGAGALAGGWLARRGGPSARAPVDAWMAAQALLVVSTVVGLTLVDARQIRDAATAAAAASPGVEGWSRALAELWFNARPMLLVAGVPALVMGVAFPLGNAIVQRTEDRVGRRAGLLYLANTAGAVCGSLVAGFLLLPAVGLQTSVTILVAAAAGAIVPLHLAAPRVRLKPDTTEKAGGVPPKPDTTERVRGDRLKPDTAKDVRGVRLQPDPARYVPAAALATAALALGAWLLLPGQYLISKGLLFPLDSVYGLSEGLTEVIAVTDGPNGGRVLVTNGHPMSSTELFSQRYMRAMAHIPLLAHADPRRVLVLCYGVGNTAHAAALHPSVERIEIVDLSRHVLEHSSYFEAFNRGVLRDPRVAVYINDGRHHLRMQPAGAYDLITLEPPPIVHAGVAALYSREFYASARSRLAPSGMLSQWLPVFGVSEEVVLAMTRAFVDVFPNAVLLSGANMNLLLVGANDARNEIDPGRLAAALARAPDVRADLARLDLATPRDIVGTFVAPAAVLAEATRGAQPVTDDRPLQEYGKWSLVDFGDGGIPASLVDVRRVADWCPGCFRDGTPAEPVGGLDAYLALTELAYRSPADRSRADAAAPGRLVAGSGYLGSIVPDTPEVPALVAALETPAAAPPPQEQADARYTKATTLLEAGRFEEAIEEFRAVLRLAPGTVEARNNLGVALASLGRLDEAIAEFERALAIRPAFADAQRNLALAREKQRTR